MQITLNQIEIETALRQYVETQVNLREGQDITIDLKASRGPEGFTATIDIVPASVPRPEPQATPRGLGIAAKVSRQQPAQEAASAPQEAPDTHGAGNTQTAASAAEQRQEEAAEDAEPQRTSGSIFAGLQKPRNS